MILNQQDCLVLIIDIQEKLLNAVFNKDILEKKSEKLSKAASILNIPVLVTEQYPKGLGNTVENIKNNLNSALYFEKTSFDALENFELVEALKVSQKKQIIICGIETHICVHQTIASLIKQNYNVTVVSDACGSRYEVEHKAALDYIKSYGAKIKTTEMILFELLKTSKHPEFKAIQNLIK